MELATRATISTLSFALALAVGACTEPSVGAPCEVDADCDAGMICDIHDNQGTCQDDHGHGETDGEEHSEHGETHGEQANCAMEDRDDEFSVGLSKSGELLTATFVSADPAPPGMDDNTWVLALTDADGMPVEDLDIVATPWMPDHDHGTPIEVEVSATGTPGEYELSPVNLFMAGYWEVTLDVSMGDDQDSMMFGFCVE